jgi:hypothetical protein
MAKKAREELTNPQEWLHHLAAERDGFARLIRESGGSARAAYRVARARCAVESVLGASPTLEDLQAAARLLAAHVGRGGALPITSLLPSSSDEAAPRAIYRQVENALRSAPPPAPSTQARVAARMARKPEAQSRPSAAHQ